MSGPFVYQDVINEELLRIYAEKLFGHCEGLRRMI